MRFGFISFNYIDDLIYVVISGQEPVSHRDKVFIIVLLSHIIDKFFNGIRIKNIQFRSIPYHFFEIFFYLSCIFLFYGIHDHDPTGTLIVPSTKGFIHHIGSLIGYCNFIKSHLSVIFKVFLCMSRCFIKAAASSQILQAYLMDRCSCHRV